ncbi:HET-domain-containing protein [Apiospora arundinis]
MRTLAAFPFGPSTLEQQAPLSDEDAAAFRYEPHVLCPACRELLTLAIELQRQRGAQLSEYIETTYDFGQLCGSAKLGCHMCALLEAAMWTRPRDIVEGGESHMWGWEVAFALLPATDPDALLLITIECSGAGSMRGYSLPVFPSHGAESMRGSIRAITPKTSLSKNTGDDETFEIAEAWLQKCLKEHKMCAENDDEARIVRPRRLLHLGDTISLVDSQVAAGQDYVALSHCWGRHPEHVPRLEHKTEAKLRAGVELSFLPKTFQHAVAITRRLGYRFLWIDSLCIVQDSTDDWKDQAKIMALVYTNSVFTIAALKSSGSTEGCYTKERNPLRLRPCVSEDLGVTVSSWNPGRLWEVEVNTSGYGASPLHSRAWVVQERYSAPRTLLYGANGIYWECRCAQASEAHYCDVAWDDESNKKTWLQRLEVGNTGALQQSGWDTKRDSKVITWKDHWIGLLKAYSSCELTVKSDKIIAVTGLISEIERRSKVRPRCILGLWDYDLPGMALWYRSRDSMNSDIDFVGRLKNNMPTWTWASVEGRCSYLLSGGEIEWQAAVSIDESTLPATMSIETWCRKVLLDEDDAIQLDPDDPKTGQKGWGGDLDETYSWFPDSEMPEAGTRSALFVVPMQRVRISSGLWVARCLVLTTCIKEVGVFTRIGVVLIRYSDKRDDPFKSKDDEAQEMILLR